MPIQLGLSVVGPTSGHTHTVIFLHGRGDTGPSVARSLFRWRDSSRRDLQRVFPTVRWVFPQAEILHCERGQQDWSQWFDVWNPLDFFEREELQAPGLRDSVDSVRALVHREAEAVGGLGSVVLAGLGQGGATAVHTLLNLGLPDGHAGPASHPGGGEKRPARLAGLVAFCCRLPFPGGTLEETRELLDLDGTPTDDILKNTPVFLAHCCDDPLVFVELGRQLAASLEGFGSQVHWKEYAKGGHWINSPKGVDDLVHFLKCQGFLATV